MSRVAITGLGIVSVLGNGCDAVTQALACGQSGIGVDPLRAELGFLSPLTGVLHFSSTAPLTRKQRKSMPDFAEWAYEASVQAINQSELDGADLRNDASGIIFSCDSSCVAAVEQSSELPAKKATTGLGSGLVFRSMTSCVSMNLSALLGTRGACWTISAACAGGGHALGQAADLIRLGRQERVICGGAQEITWQSMCSFDGLGAFSQRADDPQKACRPFDAGRDGLVPSGGAVALLLENYDLAKKRGAPLLGEIAGYGFSSDGEHISVPSRQGLGRAVRGALAQAGLKPGEIDYICAHATGTPVGDRMEALNIVDVFGERSVSVSSLKGQTGHELWMSGASQAAYCALMARGGFVAASANFAEGDEDTRRLDILTRNLPWPPRNVLCNSAGFGGTNAALVLRFGAL